MFIAATGGDLELAADWPVLPALADVSMGAVPDEDDDDFDEEDDAVDEEEAVQDVDATLQPLSMPIVSVSF